jgi:hypothetical protein
MTNPTWLEETSRLLQLRASNIKLRTIAADCGVSVPWLSKLQTLKLKDAPISKLQRVNDWLKANTNV